VISRAGLMSYIGLGLPDFEMQRFTILHALRYPAR
jgi:hypothetical protein